MFSLYHLARFSSLSSSGKMLAPVGLAFGLVGLAGIRGAKQCYRQMAGVGPSTEEPKTE